MNEWWNSVLENTKTNLACYLTLFPSIFIRIDVLDFHLFPQWMMTDKVDIKYQTDNDFMNMIKQKSRFYDNRENCINVVKKRTQQTTKRVIT